MCLVSLHNPVRACATQALAIIDVARLHRRGALIPHLRSLGDIRTKTLPVWMHTVDASTEATYPYVHQAGGHLVRTS